MCRLLRRVSTICLPEQREFDEPLPPSLSLLVGYGGHTSSKNLA
ncbi:hypothetical protein [Nostoc sp.]